MEPCTDLFDLSRYKRHEPVRPPRRGRRPLAMSPNVWLALLSLKAALDSVPEDELDARDHVYREKLAKTSAR
jgi:hypothetical protein